MKRNILIIFGCFFIVFLLTGCKFYENGIDIGIESDVQVNESDILLFAKENTLSKTGVTLIIKNNSTSEIVYDEPYEIEIKRDGKWYKINTEINFNEPAYILDSQESNEIKINWENEYGELETSDYRILKEIYGEKFDGIVEKFYVSYEFTIE